MVIYDDMSAGLGAQQYLDKIADRIGDGSALDVRFWKEDILRESKLWKQASADAADVDLILFSMSSSTVLPTRIIRWIQKWHDVLVGQDVSFALLTSQECQDHSLVKMVRRFLRQAANFHETRFFKGTLPEQLSDPLSAPRRSSTPPAEKIPALNHRRDGCGAGRSFPGR